MILCVRTETSQEVGGQVVFKICRPTDVLFSPPFPLDRRAATARYDIQRAYPFAC